MSPSLTNEARVFRRMDLNGPTRNSEWFIKAIQRELTINDQLRNTYAKQVARGNDMIPIGLGDPSMHGLPSLNAAQAASGYGVPAALGAVKKGGGNGKGWQKPPGGGKDGSGTSGNAAVNPNAKG